MSFEIRLENKPAGYSVSNSRAGELAIIQLSEFTTTDDGDHFTTRLEGLPSVILQALAPQKVFRESQIDHMLAIIRPDNTATVYVNELSIFAKARIARAIQAREPIRKDDIVDIERIDFGSVDVPADCGVLFIASSGWRKGMYYDLAPLGKEGRPRNYDVFVTLGQAILQLTFQERFRITPENWQLLFDGNWYPFLALGTDLIDKLVAHANAGWNLDDLVDEASHRLSPLLAGFLDQWERNPAFAPHLDVLKAAIDRYAAEDYLSCAALLYPRIEGLLRSHVNTTIVPGPIKGGSLSARAIEGVPAGSLIFPHRFEQYLNEVYFRRFRPEDPPPVELSRHSVSHGVARAGSLNKKGATIGLLIVHQLGFTLGSTRKGQAA